MAIPDCQTLMRPVLEGFAQGQTCIADIIPSLIVRFNISKEEACLILTAAPGVKGSHCPPPFVVGSGGGWIANSWVVMDRSRV